VTVLGLIPARGGSKGIPRKNLRLLGGRPLLQYTAETALGCRRLTAVALSTDDEEIAAAGRRFGLEVPFLRPAALAADTAPTLPVVQHALEWFAAASRRFDAVCLLQPTNPFRRPADVDGCIELLDASDADSVITMRPVPAEYNPHWVYVASADGTVRLSTGERAPIARRQDLPTALHRDGSVYVTRTRTVLEENSLYGARILPYIVDGEDSVNIDTFEDWAKAETRIADFRCQT
jgi:CMP-N,N'-diacetyllegionaminic acid synthase